MNHGELFKTTFYEGNRGRLVRHLEIAGMSFYEQFDWDGWYSFHAAAFIQIDEAKAIDMVLNALQVKHPDYINRGRAKFKLYEFDLGNLRHGRQLKASRSD